MAKYECRVHGDFGAFLSYLHDGILRGSMSASYEDGSDCYFGDVRCAVRVFERYSTLGGNRVSMSLTLAGEGEDLFLSAITAGGSQAVFLKLNTLGEEAFLKCVVELVRDWDEGRRP